MAQQAPWGFSRQECWSGLPCPPPEDIPNGGIESSLPHCRWILYRLSHQGSPHMPCQITAFLTLRIFKSLKCFIQSSLLLFFFFLAMLCRLWDLSPLTRAQTHDLLQWKHGVLTTGSPGMSHGSCALVLKTTSALYHQVPCRLTLG